MAVGSDPPPPRGEDRWLWPELRRIVGTGGVEAALLDDMESEHESLTPRQERLDRAIRARVVRRDPATAAEDSAVWHDFAVTFEAHLAHEERDAVPLIEQRLPPAALRRFEARQQRQLGLRIAMTQFFPWLLDEATQDHRTHALGLLPHPLRWWVLRSEEPYRHRAAEEWA